MHVDLTLHILTELVFISVIFILNRGHKAVAVPPPKCEFPALWKDVPLRESPMGTNVNFYQGGMAVWNVAFHNVTFNLWYCHYHEDNIIILRPQKTVMDNAVLNYAYICMMYKTVNGSFIYYYSLANKIIGNQRYTLLANDSAGMCDVCSGVKCPNSSDIHTITKTDFTCNDCGQTITHNSTCSPCFDDTTTTTEETTTISITNSISSTEDKTTEAIPHSISSTFTSLSSSTFPTSLSLSSLSSSSTLEPQSSAASSVLTSSSSASSSTSSSSYTSYSSSPSSSSSLSSSSPSSSSSSSSSSTASLSSSSPSSSSSLVSSSLSASSTTSSIASSTQQTSTMISQTSNSESIKFSAADASLFTTDAFLTLIVGGLLWFFVALTAIAIVCFNRITFKRTIQKRGRSLTDSTNNI